jgi:hypothetical protein
LRIRCRVRTAKACIDWSSACRRIILVNPLCIPVCCFLLPPCPNRLPHGPRQCLPLMSNQSHIACRPRCSLFNSSHTCCILRCQSERTLYTGASVRSVWRLCSAGKKAWTPFTSDCRLLSIFCVAIEHTSNTDICTVSMLLLRRDGSDHTQWFIFFDAYRLGLGEQYCIDSVNS